MPTPVEQAREAGYTDTEINAFLAPKITDALAAGYTQEEINKHLGITPPPAYTGADVARAGAANLRNSPKPVTSFTDALDAGWQISVTGLAARGKPPNATIAADAPWYSRIAASAATMAGDIPAMVGGFAVGGGMGAQTGPGAMITGMAGAFALPTALRQTLMDSYEKGQFQNFGDFWTRTSGIMIDTAKSYVTGAATGAVGGAVSTALPATMSPALRSATTGAAEIGTMVTVGKALEGHVPAAQDFVDAAILLGGFKFAMNGAARLRQIYAETGVPPRAVVEDAARDPTIMQDLAGTAETPRAYQEAAAGAPRAQPAQEGINVEVRAQREPAPTGSGEPTKPPESPLQDAAPSGEPLAPRTLEQAQEAIRSRISVGDTTPEQPLTLSRLYTMTVDKLNPMNVATRQAGREAGVDLTTSENPYQLARLIAGSSGVSHSFLEFGTRDFRTGARNGPGLREVLDPITKDLDAFRLYATSARAIELEARGIATGMDIEAARQLVEAGSPQFKATMAGLIEYQNKMAMYLRDSGVLSKAGYDAMREANQLYVPFQRVMDAGSPIGIRISPNDMQARNPIKGIEGSQRVVVDPLESIIRNTYLFTQMAQRNEVGLKLVDLLRAAENTEAAEVATRATNTKAASDELRASGLQNADALAEAVTGSSAPVRVDEIRVFRDGKAETYQVSRDLAEAFRGLDVESANLIERILAAPARTLRAGATLTPDFMARNLMRDFMTAFVNTGRGVFTPIDTMRGLVGVLRKDKDYQDWYSQGGANAALNALDRDYLQTSLQKLTEETGLMTRGWNVVRHPIDMLRMVSQVSEEATRLAVYKKMMAEGSSRADMQEAAFASREATLDFARIGSKMRAVNMISAFFNAQVQGLDRTIRQFHDAPVATSMRVAAGITIPSVLLWYANHDDPRYQELPRWQKDLFWIVMTKDNVWRIPKPFELGVIFGTGPERALDAYFANKPEAFRDFGKAVAGALLPNPTPTIAQPFIEQFANRDLFRGQTLVPAAMEKWLPEYQYTPYTTEAAKALGQLIGAMPGVRDASLEAGGAGAIARAFTSPILMENYIRAWTGGLGMYAVQLADAGLRKAGIVPDPIKPTATLADTPFLRAFAVRYPSASAQSVQDFHDDYTKNEAYYQTFMAMAKQGDALAAARIREAGGMGPFMRMTGINTALIDMTHMTQAIVRNPQITADEKRQLLDTTYMRMMELASAGNATMRGVNRALAARPDTVQ